MAGLAALLKYSGDQPRDDHGRFSGAGDETGRSAPQLGEKFTVYRLGHADERDLDDKNAGNAEGVADHVQRTQDVDRPQPAQGTGDTIHAYEVQSLHSFGSFDRFNSGQGDSQLTTPGRKVEVRRPDTAARTPGNHEFVSYSFPKGSISARHLGSISVADLQSSRMGGKDFDEMGSMAGATAIRDHFSQARKVVQLGTLLKFNPDQPRDSNGRWGEAQYAKHFADNLGIKRGDMPQIPNGAMKAKFLAELGDRGIGHTRQTVMASELKATQSTFNSKNIDYLRGVAMGKYTGNPILVANDNRVLDGHHRWAGAAIEGQPIDTIRIDMPARELVAAAREFSTRNAIPARKFWTVLGLAKFDPDQPRASNGRWGDAPDTPEFKGWFGGSKVVDAQGAPMRVFRGSPFALPEHYDPGSVRTTTPSFTSSPEIAAVYSTRSGRHYNDGSVIEPAYLRMENPLKIATVGVNLGAMASKLGLGKEGGVTREEMLGSIQYLRDRLVDPHNTLPNFQAKVRDFDGSISRYTSVMGAYLKSGDTASFDNHLRNLHTDAYALVDSPAFTGALKRMGYDGVVHKDLFSAGASYVPRLTGRQIEPGQMSAKGEVTTYRPFEGSQVKSAVGNKTFDPQSKVTTKISIATLLKEFNPNQPRDADGRFASLESRLKFDHGFTIGGGHAVDVHAPSGASRAGVVHIPSRGYPKLTVKDSMPSGMAMLSHYSVRGDTLRSEGQTSLPSAVQAFDEKTAGARTAVHIRPAQKIQLGELLKEFNPNQPRDANGRWGEGGNGHDTKNQAVLDSSSSVMLNKDTDLPKPSSFLDAKTIAEVQRVTDEYSEKLAGLRRKLSPEEASTAAAQLASSIAGAHADKPGYDKRMREIAQALGTKVMLADVKGGERLLQKHIDENNSVASEMKDLVRGSLIVDKVADVPAALNALRNNFDVVRVKNRFADSSDPNYKAPDASGYRDVLVNVKLPSGILGEVQIHVPEMLSSKMLGHALYDISRTLPANHPDQALLERVQETIYGGAFRANNARAGVRP